jgi:undecaprenyl-diphosphatase
MLPQTISRLSSADHLLMRRVNRWRPPRWARLWIVASTRCGDGWLWALIGIVLLISSDADADRAFLAATLAVSAGILLFLAVKRAVRRPRPNTIVPHCWADLLPPDQFSFPSGHSITAFAVAISLGSFYPSLSAELLFCALNVAASRVLLGMHYVTDVIAGAAIGSVLGWLAVTVVL